MFQPLHTESLGASPGSTVKAEPPPRWDAALAAGVGAALVAVPVALAAGRGVGALSWSTVLSALPALLLVAVLPPLAVVAVEARLGRGRWGLALGAALGVQVLTLVGAVWAGLSARRYGDAALLTLVEALLLPAVVTGTLKATRRASAPPQASPDMRAVALLLALVAVPRGAEAACPERASWPTQDWPTGTLAAGHEPALRAFEAYAFTRGLEAERKGVRTDGVVIIHRGRLVYERYASGWEAGKRHLGWSMAKSITNALTGLAVAHGALALEDTLCEHLRPTRKSTCGIRVRDLLESASGLDWQEGYESGPLQTSSVLAMLYGEGRADMVGFITSHVPREPPGASWEYSSGDSTLLAGVVGAAMKPQGEGWEWRLLFEPVGVRSAVWERDRRGVLVGSSLLYATPRDWAKLGFLFLNDGCWEGRRLLPEGWVAQSTAVSEPFLKKRLYWDPGDVQGRQFWLNRRVPGIQDEKPWPSVPEDAYAMRGHWGQSVTLIPSLDLVVVRTADDREAGAFNLDTFLARAIALVEAAP